MRHRGMELCEFCLKPFIHKQKCLQRASDVAIASGHDFVDGGFLQSGTHRKASKYPRVITPLGTHGLLWITWKGLARESLPIGAKSAA
jgi:hypothetical protein